MKFYIYCKSHFIVDRGLLRTKSFFWLGLHTPWVRLPAINSDCTILKEVVRRSSIKRCSETFCKYSQENPYVWVFSQLIWMSTSCNFSKKRLWLCVSNELCKIFKNSYFAEPHRGTVSTPWHMPISHNWLSADWHLWIIFPVLVWLVLRKTTFIFVKSSFMLKRTLMTKRAFIFCSPTWSNRSNCA